VRLKKYFITGLVIWVPLGITLWVLHLLVRTMDQTLLLLPEQFQTEQWLGMHVPGMGVVLTLVVVFGTGLIRPTFSVSGFFVSGSWHSEGFHSSMPSTTV